MELLFNINVKQSIFDCKTKLCLIVPGNHGKYIFTLECIYLQGIINEINEQDTFFLDCKHKHMMKSGAPPHKVGVLYHLLAYRIPWFYKQN